MKNNKFDGFKEIKKLSRKEVRDFKKPFKSKLLSVDFKKSKNIGFIPYEK